MTSAGKKKKSIGIEFSAAKFSTVIFFMNSNFHRINTSKLNDNFMLSPSIPICWNVFVESHLSPLHQYLWFKSLRKIEIEAAPMRKLIAFHDRAKLAV